jgi:hypothetical protein
VLVLVDPDALSLAPLILLRPGCKQLVVTDDHAARCSLRCLHRASRLHQSRMCLCLLLTVSTPIYSLPCQPTKALARDCKGTNCLASTPGMCYGAHYADKSYWCQQGYSSCEYSIIFIFSTSKIIALNPHPHRASCGRLAHDESLPLSDIGTRRRVQALLIWIRIKTQRRISSQVL